MPRVDPEFRDALNEEELDGLWRALHRLNDVLGQRDGAWIRLILSSGIKPSDLVALRIVDALQAIEGGPVRLASGSDTLFSANAAIELKLLLDLLTDGADGRFHLDAPLIQTKAGKPMSVRNLELRLQKIIDEAMLLTRRITIKALIDTSRAIDIAERFHWAVEWKRSRVVG